MPVTLAAFLWPALFYGGALAVASPILIHLLARRRFRRIRWAAMAFLLEAQQRRRRRIRLEEWILLALRCLAVVLLALVFARPFLRGAGVWIGSQRTERLFLLDDSFSMGYESHGETSFSRAKAAARKLIGSIRESAPNDVVTLIRMSAPEKPVAAGVYLDEQQSERLLARLEALEPSQRSVDPRRTMRGVAELLERTGDTPDVVLYVLSDFQRHGWTARSGASTDDPGAEETEPPAPPTGSAGAEGIMAPLVAWAGEDRGLRAVFINCGDEAAENRAIAEVRTQAGPVVAGAPATLVVTVANHAAAPAESVTFGVTIDDVMRFEPAERLGGSLDLAAGAVTSVDQSVLFDHAGSRVVRVELPRDGLPLDDVRHLVAEVVDAIRVLIVNGEPSADFRDDEVGFLATALRPEGELFSGIELEIVDESQVDRFALDEFHVVVLANVYRLSEPVVDELFAFVRGGGGLLVFLGDQVDPDWYNSALYRDGAGLLPAALIERARGEGTSSLLVTDSLHPAMRPLGLEGDPLGVRRIPFRDFFRCRIRPREETAEAVAAPTESDGRTLASPSVVVLAEFSADGRPPAILEGSVGDGHVVLVTTSADKEWHLWPDHPTFLPVMMELTRHAGRGRWQAREHLVGDSLELAIDPRRYESQVLVRSPGYPQTPEQSVTAVPTEDGNGLTLSWEHTDQSGIYQFVRTLRDGSQEVLRLAVNPDARESDLTMVSQRELRRAMGDVDFEYLLSADLASDKAEGGSMELWRFFLGAAVLVLMTEQFLAFLWGKRGG